jgi:hypothetical protein
VSGQEAMRRRKRAANAVRRANASVTRDGRPPCTAKSIVAALFAVLSGIATLVIARDIERDPLER